MHSSSIFDYFQLIAENIWLYGGTFLLVLGILVFVHEWGHYIVARLCGVKIDSFSIGFGKELFGVTDKHGTRWKFSLVPLGGYVKMFGDVDPASAAHSDKVVDEAGAPSRSLTHEERKGAFFAKPLWQRAAIVFAGPGINYLFAIFLLAGLYMFYGQPVTPPVAAAVVDGSAAAESGFQPHDEIIAIDGKTVRRFEDIRREVTVALDTPLEFTVLRNGQEVVFSATPHKQEEEYLGFKQTRGVLGIIGPANALSLSAIQAVDGQPTPDEGAVRDALLPRLGAIVSVQMGPDPAKDVLIVRADPDLNAALSDPDSPDGKVLNIANFDEDYVIRHNVTGALGAAATESWDVQVSTLDALGQMFTGTRSPTELGGIIRIGAIAGDMAQAGLIALITFIAFFSINLGLINLFPVPMLDGGHLLFYAIEGIKGSPISEPVQEYAFRLGLVFLVGLMLFTNLNDIVQLVM
ncbi:MAG: RIP metalloprotease RseP [Alphaproteobacteria bacterium]|nr:RIP metalloprotease RseP [Alphaproteobacteria bacterium]